MTKDIKSEGFWRAPPTSFYEDPKYRGLPWPIANERPFEGKDEFLAALGRVEAVAEVHRYRGLSTCRICGCGNGNIEYEYRGWRWPEGYRHYIEVHNVEPSPEFRAFVILNSP